MSSFPNVSPPDADVLAELGVSAAAAAIRAGDVSSEDYASALLARARANADLNAFISIDEDAVLSASRDADKARAKGALAPLLGGPLAVKARYGARGLRTTFTGAWRRCRLPGRTGAS